MGHPVIRRELKMTVPHKFADFAPTVSVCHGAESTNFHTTGFFSSLLFNKIGFKLQEMWSFCLDISTWFMYDLFLHEMVINSEWFYFSCRTRVFTSIFHPYFIHEHMNLLGARGGGGVVFIQRLRHEGGTGVQLPPP